MAIQVLMIQQKCGREALSSVHFNSHIYILIATHVRTYLIATKYLLYIVLLYITAFKLMYVYIPTIYSVQLNNDYI